MKKICLFIFVSMAAALGAQEKAPVRVGVVLSGAGVQDGSEISEAVMTILALEKGKAQIIYMAPNVPQAKVVNHNGAGGSGEGRNVMVESARITRGKVKDIKDVQVKELDALVLVGGMGSAQNLSDFLVKGAGCTVNPDLERLVKGLYSEKKPLGSMCLASVNLAKILGDKKPVITLGGNNSGFVKTITTLGAVNKECGAGDVVIDKNNRIVTTPAMMAGATTVELEIGIGKMVDQLLILAGT